MIKQLLKRPVAALLALLARGVVKRYHPKIVMITGSVGKTSTKDAVAAVLACGYYVRKSAKSQNSEFGVPLTIFGTSNPWENPLAWLRVFKTALALLVLPSHYPNLLVLEVGADRPGDLAKILKIATPDAVVVTHLPEVPVHVEAYPSPQAVRDEEFSPAYALAPMAPLIISANDTFATQMAAGTPARVVAYGTDPKATVVLSDVGFYIEHGMVAGMEAKVSSAGAEEQVVVKGSIGKAQLLSAAAAIAAGEVFGVSLSQAVAALADATPPPGRGRLLLGVHGTYLIDESYNSSPAAVEVALQNLKEFPCKGRRIAVLGDMLELGRYSVSEHERIGKLAKQAVDVLVGVGVRARHLAEAARGNGMKEENVSTFDTASAAAEALPSLVKAGDVLLIKGSQSVRTERIVEALLADPTDGTKLVRQEKEWRRRA